MKANELKNPISSPIGLQIDNLVYNQHGEIITIRPNDFHRWMSPRMNGDYGIYAIPLTPEVLEKCGILPINPKGWYSITPGKGKQKMQFFWPDSEHLHYADGSQCPEFTFLHQLQNLYFALTGTELIYTP